MPPSAWLGRCSVVRWAVGWPTCTDAQLQPSLQGHLAALAVKPGVERVQHVPAELVLGGDGAAGVAAGHGMTLAALADAQRACDAALPSGACRRLALRRQCSGDGRSSLSLQDPGEDSQPCESPSRNHRHRRRRCTPPSPMSPTTMKMTSAS